MGCDCDYEPCQIYNETRYTARKEHRCTECGGRIPKGESYVRIESLYDGRWSTDKHCGDCRVTICSVGEILGGKGCFCFALGNMRQDLVDLWDYCNSEVREKLRPVLAAYNAACKAREGHPLPIDDE